MIRRIPSLTGRNAKSLSMEYTVSTLFSPTLPMLIVQDALEKLRNLRCLRQQLDTRPKSSSGKVRTQGWIDILGIDVTKTSPCLLTCSYTDASSGPECKIHPRGRYKGEGIDVPLLRKYTVHISKSNECTKEDRVSDFAPCHQYS
jgi:hypothetical protein